MRTVAILAAAVSVDETDTSETHKAKAIQDIEKPLPQKHNMSFVQRSCSRRVSGARAKLKATCWRPHQPLGSRRMSLALGQETGQRPYGRVQEVRPGGAEGRV